MSSIYTIDPVRIFNIKSQVCTLQCKAVIAAVGNNQTLIAAVTGKVIEVMGWCHQAIGAAVGSFTYKDGSGGTSLYGPSTVPVVTAGANEFKPVSISGYGIRTTAGTGLFGDIAGANIDMNIFYITY